MTYHVTILLKFVNWRIWWRIFTLFPFMFMPRNFNYSMKQGICLCNVFLFKSSACHDSGNFETDTQASIVIEFSILWAFPPLLLSSLKFKEYFLWQLFLRTPLGLICTHWKRYRLFQFLWSHRQFRSSILHSWFLIIGSYQRLPPRLRWSVFRF